MKSVTQQHSSRELNSQPSSHESNAPTTRLPSHLRICAERNAREQPVESGVAVAGREPMQRRSNRHVLVDCHRLAVRREHRRVVVVVGDSDLDVCRVDVARVGVLNVDGQVEERIQQRVKVNRLQQDTQQQQS